MNISLASGHEKDQESPATAMSEAAPIIIATAPLIAQLEKLVRSGASWAPDFDQVADAASLALFGITKADVQVSPPTQDNFYKGNRLDDAAWNAAYDEYEDLLDDLFVIASDDATYEDTVEWWLDEGVDVRGEDGRPLRCLSFIEQQLNAALFELLPGAKLTLDGSGVRAAPTADQWGDALAREAFEFANRRR